MKKWDGENKVVAAASEEGLNVLIIEAVNVQAKRS